MTANLYDLLTTGFPIDRTRPAFVLPGGREISYGALESGAAHLAALLDAKGVKPGDRIACQAPKSPEQVMLYLAALKVGAVWLPLNTAYTESEVRYFLDDAEPVLFVTDAVAMAKAAMDLEPRRETTPRTGQDLAALVYTSGTTGRSKGAMLTHANLASNALSLHRIWGFERRDVLVHALPIFHVHGLFVALHTSFLNGSPMIWFEKFDEAAVIEALSQATLLMGVPTFYTRLLAHPDFGREACAHMRLFISGSAPLLESTFRAFEARTGHAILERYGMSEAGMITSNPLIGPRIPGSVGYPLPGVELRISGGATGVIQIKGPNVFKGYWRMPEKTAEDFTTDGYFITGDVGRQDPDGRVWISGRAKDLIISGGFNVYPKEVELVLDDLEGVDESAVIACPHPDFGEAVVAVIVGEAEETALIAAAREKLAGFKVPKRVLKLDDLPRNAMGKVQKAALRERFKDLFG